MRFEEFGPECVVALDMINSGQYDNRWGGYWLTKLPDVVRRLESGGQPIARFRLRRRACGAAIPKAFPKCEVVGLDPDPETIKQARLLRSRGAGLGDHLANSSPMPLVSWKKGEGFDLITACDCVHDFSAPGRTFWESCVISLSPVERCSLSSPGRRIGCRTISAARSPAMYYGFSLFHCMTQSLGRWRSRSLAPA